MVAARGERGTPERRGSDGWMVTTLQRAPNPHPTGTNRGSLLALFLGLGLGERALDFTPQPGGLGLLLLLEAPVRPRCLAATIATVVTATATTPNA